jgi:hypothetical protein
VINQAIKGMNTVLAKPPKKVRVMMARRKLIGKRRVIKANAGEYSTAPIATAKPSQTA